MTKPESFRSRSKLPKFAAILAITILSAAFLHAGNSNAAPAIRQVNPAPPLSSEALEKELQSLTWAQFSFVVKSIPKLKSKVDSYGPTGWRYVQSRYQTYSWKKSIDKFSPEEKKQLADLIRKARKR